MGDANLRRAGELCEAVASTPPHARALEAHATSLRDVLSAERFVAYAFEQRLDELRLEFAILSGSDGERVRELFNAFLRGRPPTGWAAYNPLHPEPWQRNRALLSTEIARVVPQVEALSVRQSIMPQVGIDGCDQLRVLVCDGPALLAFVGVYRAESFGPAEKRVLQALTSALQQRLAFERRLTDGRPAARLIESLIESLPAAAFVVRGSLVVHANSAGRAFLEQDRAFAARALDEAAAGSRAWTLRPLPEGDDRSWALLVQNAPPADPGARLYAARLRWNLSERQVQVLGLLARGESNKGIAATLGCGESTVEMHVSALLARTESESRARLVARFWTEL